MARWTIASYNRFIGARPDSVSIPEARALYRAMAARLERPVFRTDLKNHPRITKQELAKIQIPFVIPTPPEIPEEPEPDEMEEIELVGGFDSPGGKGR